MATFTRVWSIVFGLSTSLQIDKVVRSTWERESVRERKRGRGERKSEIVIEWESECAYDKERGREIEIKKKDSEWQSGDR